MPARRPPEWDPHTDSLARICKVQTVAFGSPLPPKTWCHYCGFLAQSRDHIIPDSIGGVSAWWNLVPSCHDCNNAKADRQACSCLFCLRAIALWGLGFRTETKRNFKKKKPTTIVWTSRSADY